MSPARRKPATKSTKPCQDTSDSDSDNDYGVDDVKVTLQRYTGLNLTWALATWEHNGRAIRELRALFEEVYTKRAEKAVQGAMLEDLMVAVSQSERMGRLGATLEGCVSAALRVLPKQKRSAVATAHRRAVVLHRRQAGRRGDADGEKGGKGGSSVDESDEEEECSARLPSLHDLPLEVIEAVFQYLGPVELARCACVSRSWREVAVSPHMDVVWRQLFHLTFPRSALGATARPASGSGAPQAPAYVAFQMAALGKPRRLSRWSGRVIRAGTLSWVCTEDLRHLPASALRALAFPTEAQVVQWACGRRKLVASSSSDGSSTSASEGSDSDGDKSPGGHLTRMKLWAAPTVA